jgi:hypothetical protein
MVIGAGHGIVCRKVDRKRGAGWWMEFQVHSVFTVALPVYMSVCPIWYLCGHRWRRLPHNPLLDHHCLFGPGFQVEEPNHTILPQMSGGARFGIGTNLSELIRAATLRKFYWLTGNS